MIYVIPCLQYLILFIGLTQRAVAGPPLGTQLGAMGINIAAFVKDFNLRTSVFREGVPLPTRTTVNADRSYNLTIHHPTSVYFLKQVGFSVIKEG